MPGAAGTSLLATVYPPGPYSVTQVGALGNPDESHYYVVRAFAANGGWTEFTRAAEFEFGLTEGK
jgi:hypothetical protein